jgi:hypothetical protein
LTAAAAEADALGLPGRRKTRGKASAFSMAENEVLQSHLSTKTFGLWVKLNPLCSEDQEETHEVAERANQGRSQVCLVRP